LCHGRRQRPEKVFSQNQPPLARRNTSGADKDRVLRPVARIVSTTFLDIDILPHSYVNSFAYPGPLISASKTAAFLQSS
jgi:hypothetical protein